MSDADELAEIRERKRAKLEARLAGDGATDASGTGDDGDGGATPTEPVHVTGPGHLDELTREHDVVLVDFYADWCGPCKMLEPTVETLARETDAAVAKVDIDAHQGLAGQYGVRGVPTLVLFADGEPAERVVGVKDEGTLRGLLGQYGA